MVPVKGLSPELILKLTSKTPRPVSKSSTAERKGHGAGGYFESKQGTARRSRKGRTYRAPNGYAFYCEDWSQVKWHSDGRK